MGTTWTAGLARWYAAHGRHDLPWRQTQDPWAVLVSEVMLQQTQVTRVIPYWLDFTARWPDPASFAAAPRADVLRAWQGLGYPRRAAALLDTAALVAAHGWPHDEAGLRSLPGIGRYTARALLTLALGVPSAPPLDVNISRVAARAGAGAEPNEVPVSALEQCIAGARPRSLDPRRYTFALFDAGALYCRVTPACDGCPLQRGCAWRRLGRAPAAGSTRRPLVPYATSMRRLRGVLLAAALRNDGDLTHEAARTAAALVAATLPPARDPALIDQAVASLRADRLIGG
ncbi:MAG: A/G-specific adenine glycosylase [Candidatus Dormibacteraeota bacterium]|nr:A/G-specific adenine glycosylase [Candidatus Dormibacteraeota bacterium]